MLKIISRAHFIIQISDKFNFQAEEAEKERQAQELEKQREREALALAILNGTADKMELERREKEENEWVKHFTCAAHSDYCLQVTPWNKVQVWHWAADWPDCNLSNLSIRCVMKISAASNNTGSQTR